MIATVETEVIEATEDFYKALNQMFTGDIDLMEEVWSHAEDVTLMSPFGGIKRGWEEVRKEFVWASAQTLSGQVGPRDLLVCVTGDLGYTLCYEVGGERQYHRGKDPGVPSGNEYLPA